MSLAEGSQPLSLDVVSDVVCPWCYIGKRRLEKAATAAGAPLATRWRPFQLDPTIPSEGKDRNAYLQAKFGSAERIREMQERLVGVGEAEGIHFAFDRIEISPNTLDAHRLIHWAGDAGSQDAVVEALFRAYFIEGRDIGDREVLADIAEQTGMGRAETRARLASDADRHLVRDEVDAAREIGVSGVPTFIFAGRYAVVGAQAAETLAQAIGQARSSLQAAAPDLPAQHGKLSVS